MKRYIPLILIFLAITFGIFNPISKVRADCTPPQIDDGTGNCVTPINGDGCPDGTVLGADGSCTTPSDASPLVRYELLQPLPCKNGDAGCDANGQLKVYNPSGTGKLGQYLNLMINLFIGLCAVAALVMIVLGGIEYSGSELISGKEAGKERIKNAIFGLLLALCSWLILYTINPDLLNTEVDIGNATLTSNGEITIPDVVEQIPASSPAATACANIADKKVTLIGDSLVGDKQKDGTPEGNPGLKTAFGSMIGKNLSYTGWGSSTILCRPGDDNCWGGNGGRFNADVQAQINNSSIVMISLGTNDAVKGLGVDKDKLGAAVKALLKKIPPDKTVYWIGPPGWPNTDTAAIGKIISENLTSNAFYFSSQGYKCVNCANAHNLDYSAWANGVMGWCGGKTK